MDREQRAFHIIERIYAAAVDSAIWHEVVQEVSEAFDGASVLLAVNLPGETTERERFSVGLVEELSDSYVPNLVSGLPWSPDLNANFVGGFGDMGEVFASVELRDTEFYKTWMKPQKLAPVWPIGVVVAFEQGIPVGGLSLFRTVGAPPFREADLTFGDLLVSHLTRAFHIHAVLGGARRERIALAEVVDRLPTGVILLDAHRQPVVMNRAADEILALDDGIAIDRNGPHLSTPRENDGLKTVLASALASKPGHEVEAGGFLTVTRPSGHRSFVMMVTPLLDAPPGAQDHDAAAALFIANPDASRISAREILQGLYALTPAEAELVQLLSQGHTLEEAAATRGVTINTARSQLKQVFAKTDTNRQGELVRLVMTGVASLSES
jgi:DNA-binding CsgD family transcriptional regulator